MLYKFNKVAGALASAELCWVAELRVRQLKIGSKSCSGMYIEIKLALISIHINSCKIISCYIEPYWWDELNMIYYYNMCINIIKFRKRKGERARFREYETKSCAYNQNKENSYRFSPAGMWWTCQIIDFHKWLCSA